MDPSIIENPMRVTDMSIPPHNEEMNLIQTYQPRTEPLQNTNIENPMPSKGPIILIPNNIYGDKQKTNKTPHKKGAWSPEEDQLLIDAMKDLNPVVWDVVAEKVPGRTPIQCRERWQFRLCPGVDKTKFQRWEDVLILKEQRRLGNKWTLIANKLPGRTVCSVKNRWYLYLRHLKF